MKRKKSSFPTRGKGGFGNGVFLLNDFTYYAPTEVLFGRGAETRAGEAVRRHGGSRVLVLYGGGSVIKSGLLARVEAALRETGITAQSLGGVQPNPRLSFVREAVRRALDMKADFLLAVGGGSVIDTAKAAALGAATPQRDVWDFWTRAAVPERSLPVGVVLTIPAAGSEMSDSAVLTNDAIMQKRGLSTDLNRPRFAAMNPALAETLPRYQLACGVTDILMHTLERYFTPSQGNEMTDRIAESLLQTVLEYGPRVLADPADYPAMSEIWWCGSLSHNGITGLGGDKDFATHQLGHELGAQFDKAHGATLAAVWGSWARAVLPVGPARFARYAERVWNIQEGTDGEKSRAAISRTVEFFRSLGMPTSLPELLGGPIPEEQLRALAHGCTYRGARTIGTFRVLGEEEIYAIYKAANETA